MAAKTGTPKPNPMVTSRPTPGLTYAPFEDQNRGQPVLIGEFKAGWTELANSHSAN